MANPKLIATPFAETGTRNDIPESGASEPQRATMQAGFPAKTQTPISEGGIPPERADFNGAFHLTTSHLSFLNKGNWYGFDATFAGQIGGYGKNSILMLDNGELVQSTQDGNTNNPNINMNGWRKPNNDKTGFVYASDFGLKSTNTATQNCKALQDISTFIKNNNGASVWFERGEYLIGDQTLAGATGKGASWIFSKMISVIGVTNPIHLHFEAVKFKFRDGLRHGAFDPITGDPIANGGTNQDTSAGYGEAIQLWENDTVILTGSLDIDGNDANAIVGGLYGDMGRQCVSYGIQVVKNRVTIISGAFNAHNIPLDGLYVSGLNTNESFVYINGFISNRNARQALSLTGGSNMTFESCSFLNTGFGSFPNSAPSANIDIEAEQTGLVNNVLFNKCTISKAVGGSIVSEFIATKRVKFTNCLIENDTNASIYCKSGFEIIDSYINGKIEPFYSQEIDDPARIIRSTISDKMSDGTQAYKVGYLVNTATSSVMFNELIDVKIFCDVTSNVSVASLSDTKVIKNLNIYLSGSLDDTKFGLCVNIQNTQTTGFKVHNLTTQGTLGNQRLSVYAQGSVISNAFLDKNPSGVENVLWNSEYYSGGARSGWYGGVKDSQARPLQPTELSVLKNGFESPSYYENGQVLKSSSAVPTSGYYQKGTIILNYNASIGQPFGWICTSSGEAGSGATFGKFGLVEAI